SQQSTESSPAVHRRATAGLKCSAGTLFPNSGHSDGVGKKIHPASALSLDTLLRRYSMCARDQPPTGCARDLAAAPAILPQSALWGRDAVASNVETLVQQR